MILCNHCFVSVFSYTSVYTLYEHVTIRNFHVYSYIKHIKRGNLYNQPKKFIWSEILIVKLKYICNINVHSFSLSQICLPFSLSKSRNFFKYNMWKYQRFKHLVTTIKSVFLSIVVIFLAFSFLFYSKSAITVLMITKGLMKVYKMGINKTIYSEVSN